MTTATPDPADEQEQSLINSFFEPGSSQLRSTLSVLCENNASKLQTPDLVTQTVLMMLISPVHIQLTAVGWQPFKGRELTYPYHLMSPGQREAIRALLDAAPERWNVYEHAMTYRRSAPPVLLKTLDVLEAMCRSILEGRAYQDRRMRVVVCNILLQRVQASVPIDKGTQLELNTRLFPAGES
jgi:hypothetical protein